jgi:hypothetical protein
VSAPDETPSGWWYLSFADDERFRGACVVEASDFLSAVMVTHVHRINPGGQVLGGEIPPDRIPAERFRNRLLSKADVTEMEPDSMSLGEWEADA